MNSTPRNDFLPFFLAIHEPSPQEALSQPPANIRAAVSDLLTAFRPALADLIALRGLEQARVRVAAEDTGQVCSPCSRPGIVKDMADNDPDIREDSATEFPARPQETGWDEPISLHPADPAVSLDTDELPRPAVQGKLGLALAAEPVARIVGNVLQGTRDSVQVDGLREGDALAARIILRILHIMRLQMIGNRGHHND